MEEMRQTIEAPAAQVVEVRVALQTSANRAPQVTFNATNGSEAVKCLPEFLGSIVSYVLETNGLCRLTSFQTLQWQLMSLLGRNNY